MKEEIKEMIGGTIAFLILYFAAVFTGGIIGTFLASYN